MPESAQLNILIETGTDFVLPFTVYDNNGNPLDLTGATVESQLREYAEAYDFFEFACMHNGSGGRITVTMPHETTAQIPFTHGVYDVKVTLADGTISHPLSGEVTIKESVTKSSDGSILFMLGINSFEDLPEVGNVDRLYFVYGDRKIYRWNGSNYIATAVGNGIQKIEFVEHVDDFSDKYRITYDDGTHFDYLVTTRGIDHISLIGSTGTVRTGVIDQYRIYFSDDTTHDYYVTNGRAFDVKTSYDATQAYEYLDMVKVSGATYVAVQDVPADTAITNTDYWLKIFAPLTIGTVTTVSADTGASASIGGTADAPMLNMSIPRGVAGNESINDNKGQGDTDYVWSAGKTWQEVYYANLGEDLYFTSAPSSPYDNLNTIPVNKVITYGPSGYPTNIPSGLSGKYITVIGFGRSQKNQYTSAIVQLLGARENATTDYMELYTRMSMGGVSAQKWTKWAPIDINPVTSLHGYGEGNVTLSEFVEAYGDADGAPKQIVMSITSSVGSDFTDYGFPENESGLLTTISKNASDNNIYGIYQFYFTNNHHYWVRNNYTGTFSKWSKFLFDDFIENDRDNLLLDNKNNFTIETDNSTMVREVTVTSLSTDGTIVFDGTVTSGNPAYRTYSTNRNIDTNTVQKSFNLVKGKRYVLGYKYISGSGSSQYTSIRLYTNGNQLLIGLDVNNFDTEVIFSPSADMTVTIRIYGSNGATYDDYKILPYFMPLETNPIRITPSMFSTIAVVGDSFASGISGEDGTAYEYSWLQMMAREYGCQGYNFSKGGLTTRTWLTSSYGKTKLENSDPCNIYFIALGINDSNPDDRNVPLGTIADMDMQELPDTYYGNMQKIRNIILAKNPNAVFCYITPMRIGTRYVPYQDACLAIAQKYGCLAIDWRDVIYRISPWWIDNQLSSHPRVPMYNAMMHSIVDLLSEAIEKNMTYMSSYPNIINA